MSNARPFKSTTWRQRVAVGAMDVFVNSSGAEASCVGFEVVSATSIGIEASNTWVRGGKTVKVINGGAETNVVEVSHGIYWGYGCSVY